MRLRETQLFVAAVGVLGLHVADDNYLQPQPGTGPGDHLASGLVPLAILAVAVWAYPRLRGMARGALALFLAPLTIVAGVEALNATRVSGPAGDDLTGLLTIPAGLLLLGVGAVTLWRTRRTTGHVAWRWGRRGLLAGAAYLIAPMLWLPIGLGYVATHVARVGVPAGHLGVAYENVKFRTSDGLQLEGWYVPSKNGAAVIAFPGRKGPQPHARMLARHGYGVLLFDRRGEGASDGDPNIFGWGGDEDVKAAIAYLRRRPDVHGGRIGGIGLSVGGELMLEAAAETTALKAVVSEGGGARSYTEDVDEDAARRDGWKVVVPLALKTASTAVFANRRPPRDLRTLVPRIAPRPLLLIAAPNSNHGEELNREYYKAAGEPKALWELPESRHIGGITARPAEYERRVIGFFDAALLS